MKIFNLIITTQKQYRKDLQNVVCRTWDDCEKVYKSLALNVINPVIHDLEKLRADTWNQDKITYIQKWLKDNFKEKKC